MIEQFSLTWRCLISISLVVFGLYMNGPSAIGQTANLPKQWAVLIGCERYEKATPLKYTVNDVEVLSQTLQRRGGYDPKHLLVMTDNAIESTKQSLRDNIRKELPKFFDQIAPGDSVLVYFTGHGFKDDDDKLYLAPLDINPDEPASTGIAVEWLRKEIADCRADFKLLVLDACHAGSEKGEEESPSANISEKDLQIFNNLEGVITLASSKSDEKSQIWYENVF